MSSAPPAGPSVLLVLPFGVKTAEEAGIDKVPGQADSAPHEFRMGKVLIRTTIVATSLFLIFYFNYVYGWVTPEMLDLTGGGFEG